MYAVDEGGGRELVPLVDVGGGVAWEALIQGADGSPDHYLVVIGEQDYEEEDSDEYVCGCNQSSSRTGLAAAVLPLLILLTLVIKFVIRRRRK